MKKVLLSMLALSLAALNAGAAKRVVNGKIAFATNRDGNVEIYSMKADGSALARLTNNSATDTEPAYSPDGHKIAFASDRASAGIFAIFVMNADGTGVVQLTGGHQQDRKPAWSPDGKQIAFASSRDGNIEIYKMNADGSGQTRLTANTSADDDPAWSPDGQTIAYGAFTPNFDLEIILMNADGSNPRQLTPARIGAKEPSFSPDGRKIVYSGFTLTSDDEIHVINVDGSGDTRYSTTPSGDAVSPSFSPDGTKILFTHVETRSGPGDLALMNADGTNFQLLSSNTFDEAAPSWQPASPVETIGTYRPSTGQWFLRSSNTAGPANAVLTFGGQAGDLPVTGDWDNDGRTDLGIFRNGTFLFGLVKTTYPCSACLPQTTVQDGGSMAFGQAGDIPISGDWDGDGADDVGVFRPGDLGTFILRVKKITYVRVCPTCAPTPVVSFVAESHTFGQNGDLPVAGDWDNDGKDTFGTFRPGSPGTFLLTDDTVEADIQFLYGTAGDRPLYGDWLGNFADHTGVFRSSTATMLLDTNFNQSTEIAFAFGGSGDLPVAGHWGSLIP